MGENRTLLGLSDQQYREYVATHEAGHIVAYHRSGIRVMEAGIGPAWDVDGAYMALAEEDVQANLQGRMVGLWAGLTAGFMWLQNQGYEMTVERMRSVRQASRIDVETAEAAATTLGVKETTGQKEASELMRQHWSEVTGLADLMTRHARLCVNREGLLVPPGMVEED